MVRLNDYRIRLMLIGIVAAMMFGGGHARADFVFGPRARLGSPINSSYGDGCPCISADGLSLYFNSDRPGASGIYIATRETTDDQWSEPVNLGLPVSASADDFAPRISADGLTLFFSSTRAGGYGGMDIWVSTRQTEDDIWGDPVNLGPPVNTSAHEMYPSISANGLELYFSDFNPQFRPGGHGLQDLWVTKRATRDEPWSEPVNLGPVVNSTSYDSRPYISPDGLLLFFDSARPGGYGASDLYVTRRASLADPWETPVNLGPNINTSTHEESITVSFDGMTLFYDNYTTRDIWQAPIITIVDLNGDGIVDASDMCTIVDNWGEDYHLCDIGPMPWGDGIVDVEDLKVLAEYFFEEVNDPTLVAHWSLDEVQGDIAYNSAADCDGTLRGSPVWQPSGGVVDGALQFDGIDDYINTDSVLNPGDGKFSAVVWIKDAAPGQVVLSQVDGVSWLCTDSVEGCLMTELTNSGRSSVGPMLSQANITDGTWHRIAVVWDGVYRHLYVDGSEVAIDSEPLSELTSAEGGLYIGVGSFLAPATFFSGLIDDVRIYNRVVSP